MTSRTPKTLELALALKWRELRREMRMHAARIGEMFADYRLEIALARSLQRA